jgi:predicted HTH transcriptional regulator
MRERNEKYFNIVDIFLLFLGGIGIVFLLARFINNYRKMSFRDVKSYNKQAAKQTARQVAMKRRMEIIKFMKQKEFVKSSELIKQFHNINPRTLRRDLQWLEDAGKIQQRGLTRDSEYFVKN